MSLNNDIKKLALLFIVYRVALFVLGYLASFVLNYDPSFPYSGDILASFDLPRWLYSWGNFDGVHYITLVRGGYSAAAYIQAFFPLFPILIYLTTFLVNNILLAGLLLSNALFLLLLIIFFTFIQQQFNRKMAWTAIVALLLFPTAFFFGALYTESLFLSLVLLAFMTAYKKKFLISALCIALASSTKVVGIILVPAIMVDVVFAHLSSPYSLAVILKAIKDNFTSLLTLSLGSVGLFAYMYYLQINYNDPLYFFHVQSEFGGVRQEELISYPQVLYRSLRILMTVDPTAIRYLSYVQEFCVGLFGLLALLYAGKIKSVKAGYVLFSLAAFIVPTLTGTFSSMPRYALISFPIFIVISHLAHKYKKFAVIWFALSTLLLIFNTILFVQGYWVA